MSYESQLITIPRFLFSALQEAVDSNAAPTALSAAQKALNSYREGKEAHGDFKGLNTDQSEKLESLLQADKYILSIKHYRDCAGCSLTEARAFIDGVLAQRRA